MNTTRILLASFTSGLCAAAGPALGADIGFGTNYSATTPSGGAGFSYTTPAIPFPSFGIQFSASYQPRPISASFDGFASFSFPDLTPSQVLAGWNPTLPVGYTPSFSGTQLSGGADFGGSVGFHYAIGPLSGDVPIGSANLAVPVAGAMAGNSPLAAGGVQRTATAPLPGFGLSLNALLASASASVDPSLAAVGQVGWTPSFQYGYYEWVNTNGALNAGDQLTWVGVAPGASLNFAFAPPPAFSQTTTYFFNALPAVRLDASFSQQQRLDLKVDLNLDVEVFGATVLDYHKNLASVTLLKNGYGFTQTGTEWVADSLWSVPVRFDDQNFTVQAQSGLHTQSMLSGHGGTITPTPDSPGGLQPGPAFDVPGEPPVEYGGVRWALNDPALPIGPGTVTVLPEPPDVALWAAGLAGVAGAARRRRRA